MAHTASDVRAVQSRLQELIETLPSAQADVLEAVVAGAPLEIRDDAPDSRLAAQDRAIIIVGGRGSRWLVFDVDQVLSELNPQPLPPDTHDLDRFR